MMHLRDRKRLALGLRNPAPELVAAIEPNRAAWLAWRKATILNGLTGPRPARGPIRTTISPRLFCLGDVTSPRHIPLIWEGAEHDPRPTLAQALQGVPLYLFAERHHVHFQRLKDTRDLAYLPRADTKARIANGLGMAVSDIRWPVRAIALPRDGKRQPQSKGVA